MDVIVGVVNVEIGVEIVMLKGLVPLAFLILFLILLLILFPINLNLLLQLPFSSHYNFSL
jgi:hypothetical protein